MNTKNFWLSGLAAFVVMFTLSGIWYLMIMTGFYAKHYANIERESSSFLFVMLGYAIMAFLLALVYPKGYKGGAPAQEGMRFGLLMGLLIWLPVTLILYGVWQLSLTACLVDTVYHVVEVGLGGLVIGLIYGNPSSLE